MKTHLPLPPEPDEPTPPEDFPAAHSMDTDWFAVDVDGRLAYFDSGEVGPARVGKSMRNRVVPPDDSRP